MLDAAAEVSLVHSDFNRLHGGVVANGHVWHILCLDRCSFAPIGQRVGILISLMYFHDPG